MDNRISTTGSSDGRQDQGRQSRSPERRDRPTTSQERENYYLRHLRSVSHDSPSNSDTNYTTASELGQQRDQDHLQHDREQERQPNILHRVLGCVLDCMLLFSENIDSNVDNRRYEIGSFIIARRQNLLDRSHLYPAYEHSRYEAEPESYWQREERQREERQRQEMRGQLLNDGTSQYQPVWLAEQRQARRGELLGIDLSKVEEKIWVEFSQKLMVKHGDLHINGEDQSDEEDRSDKKDQIEKKDLRLLGDILIQYGTSKMVKTEERNNKAYKELKSWVVDQWNNRDKDTVSEEKVTS